MLNARASIARKEVAVKDDDEEEPRPAPGTGRGMDPDGVIRL